MRAYHGMPVTEFIDQLRTAAINGKAAPAIVYMIDELYTCPDADTFDDECSKSFEQGYDKAEKESQQAIDQLEARVEALENDLSDANDEIERLQKTALVAK